MTYDYLVQRYGPEGAFDMLVIIEKLARLKGEIGATMTEDERLQLAITRLNDASFGARAAN
ncbi:MAG: hypothetical protein GC131_08145 [Alphaproteobacteria bacterium]|nr:hypothetical protein [Alphaproteobacteria bacterium]